MNVLKQGVVDERLVRTKVFKGGTRRNEDNDTKASQTQVLLKLEVLIGSDEDTEAAVRRALK